MTYLGLVLLFLWMAYLFIVIGAWAVCEVFDWRRRAALKRLCEATGLPLELDEKASSR